MKCLINFVLICSAFSSISCKSRRPVESQLETSVSINTDIYAACISGEGGACDALPSAQKGKIYFYAQSPDGNPILTKAIFEHLIERTTAGAVVTVKNKNENVGKIAFANNDTVIDGYITSGVDCVIAYQFAFGPSTPDESKAGMKCDIYLDHEDKGMYAVTVVVNNAQIRSILDNYKEDPKYSVLSAGSSRRTDFKISPLVEGSLLNRGLAPMQEVNVSFDERATKEVVDAMTEFYVFYTDNGRDIQALREWRTCLRYGRAIDWLDLQAHFYCILPASPHRQCYCYTTSLVSMATGLNLEQNPEAKLGKLFVAYNQAFSRCFGARRVTVNKNDPMYQEPDAPSNPKYDIFRTIMWTKTGYMDFNVEWSNKVINDFFKNVNALRREAGQSPIERFPRLLEPDPWNPRQQRYDDIRSMQYKALGSH